MAVALGLTAMAGLVWPAVWGEAEPGGKGTADESSASKPTSAVRVDVVRPVRGGVRRLTIQPGSLHAFESVDLYAKVSGFLKTQEVDLGSPVKKGQVLAEIDAPEVLKDVDEAAAAVEQARAKAEQSAARVATAESERDTAAAAVEQADADIARLVANRVLSGKQYDRIKDLYARNAVDRKLVDEQQHDMESAQAAEKTGQAAVKTARARAAAAEAMIHQAKTDEAEARSAIRVAETRRERARVVADYTRIIAPFDGIVTERNFHPGAFIRSAADGTPEPLLTVRRTDLMRVVVQVPDMDVPLLDAGDRATIAIDALKGREFKGTIARLGSAEDPTTRTMRVEIDLPNPDGRLYQGMYGRATIELQPPTDKLTVPAACLIGHSAGKAALFLVRDGKARKTPVTIGSDDGTSVEVLSGLGPGDDVVIRPGTTLEDDTPVTTGGG